MHDTDTLRRRLRLRELEAEFSGHPVGRQFPATPSYLRTDSSQAVVNRLGAVDKEAKVLRGYVVATHGPFKTPGRGKFNNSSLAGIVDLINASPLGVKSRFTHPDASSDGLGKFLGRSRTARLGQATVTRDGKAERVPAVRADLHFDRTSFRTPSGDLGGYVLDLASSDPDALSSSLVLQVDRFHDLDEKGQPKTDEKGYPLPPLWIPKRVHASDIVDEGDAVDGILSVDTLPLGALWRGPAALASGDYGLARRLLDSVFAGHPDDVVRARGSAYIDRFFERAGTVRTGDTDRRDTAEAWLERYIAER